MRRTEIEESVTEDVRSVKRGLKLAYIRPMAADSLPGQWSDSERGLERKRRPGLIHEMPTSSADNTTGLWMQ